MQALVEAELEKVKFRYIASKKDAIVDSCLVLLWFVFLIFQTLFSFSLGSGPIFFCQQTILSSILSPPDSDAVDSTFLVHARPQGLVNQYMHFLAYSC